METIKKYMESLFINMPNTPEVCKAKEHLMEMAEDKYQSLKEEGISDNEAVARVISEFGNLDELKEELGIAEEVIKNETVASKREIIPLSDVKEIISDFSMAALIRSLGILMFICCVTPTMIVNSRLGGTLMFVMIGLGIVAMVVQASFTSRWKHLSLGKCAIDMDTAEYVKEERRRKAVKNTACKCMGIFLLVTCFVPSMYFRSRVGGVSIFFMVGLGVFLLVYAAGASNIYTRILGINPQNTMGGTYSKGSGRVIYDNPNVAAVMSVYWTLAVCVYLSISFLTFAWHITWIILVIASLVQKVIQEVYGRRE